MNLPAKGISIKLHREYMSRSIKKSAAVATDFSMFTGCACIYRYYSANS